MIYCDKCYNCSKRDYIEKDKLKAKIYFADYGSRYIFECGAFYLPVFTNIKEICDYDFQEVHCGCNKK